MHDVSQLYGLVLAGGHSRRMGRDKGLISYHGKPQREYLFEMLQELCVRVYTSCRSEQVVPAALNPLSDALQIQSPLNGILSAMQLHPDNAWLTVPVDLPNITIDLLRELGERRDPMRLATCFFDDDAQAPEPLLTIWEPAARPLLETAASKGDISPRSFLQSHNVQILPGIHPSVLLNVNDPVARARWNRGRAVN